MIRLLKGMWALAAVIPLLLVLDPAVGTVEVAVATGVLYSAGWAFLLRGVRRDPDGRSLAGFAATTLARVLASVGFLIVCTLAVRISGGAALAVFLVAAVAILALWALRGTTEEMTASAANVALLVVSLTVCAAAAEVVFRLPPVVAVTGGDTPGLQRWAEDGYDRLWTKNRLGLRSLHIGQPRPPGTLRIVTVGDSFTWGYLVGNTADIWPYVLERELTAQGLPVQVINLGRNGLNSSQEHVLLREIGWLFDPDLVIVQYTLNDPLPGAHDSYFRLAPLVPGLNDILDRNSYFFSFLNTRFRRAQMRILYPEGLKPLYAPDFPGWQASQRAVHAMADDARQRNAPMVMILFPMFLRSVGFDAAEYPLVDLHEKVAEVCREAGLPLFDLRQQFAVVGRDGGSWWAHPADGHPDEEGHRLAGRAIAREVAPLLAKLREERDQETTAAHARP